MQTSEYYKLLGLQRLPESDPKTKAMFGFDTLNQLINLHKALCTVVILFLMLWYNAWSSTSAWVYLSCHSAYGLAWCLKWKYFPDKGFDVRLPLPIFLFSFFVSSCHWIAPYYLISSKNELSPGVMCLGLWIYHWGIVWMFASDCQKYYALKFSPGNLIEEGFFSSTRNPNYFGEILIYIGFIILSGCEYIVIGFNLCVWVFLFYPNWISKDKSLSRYKVKSKEFLL